MSLIGILKRHEGFRAKPYKDKYGHLTIGYGRTLDIKGITEREAHNLLVNDILDAQDDLRMHTDVYIGLDKARQDVLTNMVINMGIGRPADHPDGPSGVLGFTRMWAALKRGDWKEAEREALDSKWAKEDVGRRAVELSEVLRTGVAA